MVSDRFVAERVTLGDVEQAVATSRQPCLDLPVALEPEVRPVLDLITELDRRAFRLNVPLSAVVALKSRPFAGEARTWRTLLTALMATPGVDRQLELAALLDSSNAAFPGFEEEIRFEAVGGAAVCVSGIEKCVVMACWLGARDGAQAKLENMRVGAYSLYAGIRNFLCEHAAEGEYISLARHVQSGSTLIKAWGEDSTEFYSCDGEHIRQLKQDVSLFGRLMKLANPLSLAGSGFHWHDAPPEWLTALCRDDWVRSPQLK